MVSVCLERIAARARGLRGGEEPLSSSSDEQLTLRSNSSASESTCGTGGLTTFLLVDLVFVVAGGTCCLPFDFFARFPSSPASYRSTSSGSAGRTMHAGIQTRRWLSGSGGGPAPRFFLRLPVSSRSPPLSSSDSEGSTS